VTEIAEDASWRSRFERSLSWIVPTTVIALGALAYLLLPTFRGFANEAFAVFTSGDLQRIQEWVQGFGAWSLLVIVIVLIVQPLLVVVPSALMMVVAVVAYGPVWGGLLAWGGSILAAVVGYGVGWALSPVTVDRLIGHEAEQRVESYVERYGFWAVALFRVSPVLSTDAISIVAGLLEMRFGRYAAATALGFLPLAAAIALLGGDLDRMQTGLLWGTILSVVVFIAYIGIDQWRRRT
jgi:uncharacterized membrane protein YdjX (TVP38/TMEM64 family)